MSCLKARAAKLFAAAACTLLVSNIASAAPIVYGFDGFDDGTALSTQYAGLTFSQATVFKAGFSLNEFIFPPRSLDGIVYDDGGAISLGFSTPVFSVGGYFTYLSGLTLSAYDSNGLLLGSVSGAYSNNTGDGGGDAGSSPNEFLAFSSAGGLISRVTFVSSPAGGSFALDDLEVDNGAAVPEPSSLALMAGALCAALARRRRPRRT